MATTIIVVLLLLFIALKIPIAVSMGLTSIAYFLILDIPDGYDYPKSLRRGKQL